MLQRQRLRFTFWLDYLKPDENELIQIIENLKKSREFTKSVRDGIRLIWDLSQGHTDVLKELFPWVKDALSEQNKNTSGNGGYILPKGTQDALQAQLKHMEKLIMQQGNTASNATVNIHKPHHVTQELTLNDLPELESKPAAKSNENSSQNLLNALSGLTGTKQVTLKPAVPKVSSIITGSDVVLAAPSFEDLTLDF